MRITFRGAAGTVAGSLHEVEFDDHRFLLDCGLYQGRRSEARKRNRELPFDADTVNGVVLSNANIDHSGILPSLTR